MLSGRSSPPEPPLSPAGASPPFPSTSRGGEAVAHPILRWGAGSQSFCFPSVPPLDFISMKHKSSLIIPPVRICCFILVSDRSPHMSAKVPVPRDSKRRPRCRSAATVEFVLIAFKPFRCLGCREWTSQTCFMTICVDIEGKVVALLLLPLHQHLFAKLVGKVFYCARSRSYFFCKQTQLSLQSFFGTD